MQHFCQQPTARLARGTSILSLALLWGFRYRGWIGALILIPAGLITAFNAPAISHDSWLSLALNALGWITFITGAAARIWATCYVGGRKRSQLITSGPYSLCRNPLYLGSFLVALSAGLFLKSLLLLAAVAVVALAYMLTTIPWEEQELRAVHAAAYVEYCRRSRRFWPAFAAYHTPETLEVNMPALKREAKRMLVWMWLPLLCQLVEVAREASWWPQLFHLP